MPCEKRGYTSQRVAEDEGRRIGDESGDTLRAYLCPKCSGWHLTKQMDPHLFDLDRAFWTRLRSSRAPRARTKAELQALAEAMRKRGLGEEG